MPSSYKIRWPRLELKDIQKIDEYISQDSPEAAGAIVKYIHDAAYYTIKHY